MGMGAPGIVRILRRFWTLLRVMVVEARDYKEAKEAAVSRNPNAKSVSVTAVF